MNGIDISSHNGKIDFNKIKNEVDFVMIRATVGRKKVDEKFKQNIESCLLLNIPVGVYVYSYALNVEQAKEEAKFLIETIKGYKLSYPVIIDMEDADGYKQKYGFPKNSELVSICETECLLFEESGYYAGIYASKSWFDTKLKSKKLDRFDKWIAWWSNKEKIIDTKIYGIWQKSDKGKIKGIRGNVDLNESFRNYPKIIANMKKEAPINYKKNEIMYVPVKDTGARDGKNSLVEFDRKQFWIDNSEFLERKSEIIGKICFEKQFTYGLAFHYYYRGIKKEFQFEVLKSICK